MNSIILLLGSNIEPEKNMKAAVKMLDNVIASSNLWKTRSFGSKGPDFLNLAVEVHSPLDQQSFKQTVIREIEQHLGRVRTADKYAPRTIDVDIVIFNGEVVDPDVWEKGFMAVPVSELRPNLVSPDNHKLSAVAKKLKSAAGAELFISESQN